MKSFPTKVYLLAFVLRLIPVLLAFNLGIGLDDMFQYDMLGRSLTAGEGFKWYAIDDLQMILPYVDIDIEGGNYDPSGVPTSFRAPLYPSFLAVVYALFGLERRFFFARLLQAAITALLAPLTYALARRAFPEDERIARYASVALAVYPLLVLFPIALATENLFFVLVLAFVVALLKAGASGDWRHYLLAGLTLGLAALTRSVVLAMLPFAMLWVWFWAKHRRGALILPAIVILMVAPWVTRNSLLHGELSTIESSMGYNLYLGYHPEGNGSFQFGISLDLLTILDDAERDRLGTQAALDFIRDEPALLLERSVQKLGHFFAMERRAITYFYASNFFGYVPAGALLFIFGIFVLPFMFIASLAALGLPFQTWSKERMLLLLLAVSYLLPHVFIMSEERFHLTLVPIIAVFAAHAWLQLKEILKKMRSRPYLLATTFAVFLLILLWGNWGAELWRDADKLAILFGPDGNLAGFSY
ncbi:MAG: hypothetical protein DWQ07_13130 [Chloroflexi bacterium]|nr:MAG: hypothetical protein DWQ07_13130 [Chloroflexota bacterium]MBL1196821.1 hypothetical protein [Chloroflexota bacterium]NOH14116.1 hypothetical protein [Chloroflexota bacterium]